MNQTQSELI